MGSDSTLCGLPRQDVEILRHLFRPEDASVCDVCRSQALRAQFDPRVQEQLLELVREAPPSTMRDELAHALARGATVVIWVHGPGRSVMRHLARLDDVVEGLDGLPPRPAFGERIGLARVMFEDREFLIVFPKDATPAIARLRPRDGTR